MMVVNQYKFNYLGGNIFLMDIHSKMLMRAVIENLNQAPQGLCAYHKITLTRNEPVPSMTWCGLQECFGLFIKFSQTVTSNV
jgi:hypothetical protein